MALPSRPAADLKATTTSPITVTATHRLARHLRRQPVPVMRDGLPPPPTSLREVPHVSPWEDWVQALCADVLLGGAGPQAVRERLSRRVMNEQQQRLLWERVIRADLEGSENTGATAPLFDVAALSAAAADADAAIWCWGLKSPAGSKGAEAAAMSHDANSTAWTRTEESVRLLRWRDGFHRWCDEQGWTTPARRAAELGAWLEGLDGTEPTPSPLPVPRRLHWAGFHRLNLPQRQISQWVRRFGGVVEPLEDGGNETASPDPALPVRVVACDDIRAECRAAAQWAARQLTEDPRRRLALVVPDLAGRRILLQAELDDALCPELARLAGAEAPRPYNLSLGVPLDSLPIVATALQLLALATARAQPVEQAQISRLLRDPCWSAWELEADARAQLEAKLRRATRPRLSLAAWARQAERLTQTGDTRSRDTGAGSATGSVKPLPASSGLAQALAHLQVLVEATPALSHQRLPSVWAAEWPGLLRRWGWLAQRSLSSPEFQARTRFLETVQRLARLDAFTGPVTAARLTQLLAQACRMQLFQPETEGEPAVQVLGLLEADGLPFDAVWVMGLSEAAWPPPPRPNALLPAAVQRHHQLPNASAAVQLAYARHLQAGWLQRAEAVVMSWPLREGEAERLPSPLLRPWMPAGPERVPPEPTWVERWVQSLSASDYAAPLVDRRGPPVPAGQRVKGGTWLLRAQAVCPAWAFHQYRLGAKALDEVVDGLDARQRGTLVHESLEAFWRAIRSSHGLTQLSPQGLADAIAQAVGIALNAHDADPARAPLSPVFRELESQRLQALLTRWMATELNREQPFEVVGLEQTVRLDIEGIEVKMSLDRVDLLLNDGMATGADNTAAGARVVIDYKTGQKIDTANWASDRLTEPQLPIYAALALLASADAEPAEGEATPTGMPPAPVHGVAFAKVHPKAMAFEGYAAEAALIPGVRGLSDSAARKRFPADRFPTWDAVLQHWAARIRAVALEVRQGEAGFGYVTDEALAYCDVKPLLRLPERAAQAGQR